MKNKIITSFLMLILVGVASMYFKMASKPQNELSTMPIGGDFSLPSTRGEFDLKDYRGKVVIVYFGFTFCPDICPTTLTTLGALLKKLPKNKLKQVEVVFISVDPERDTLDKLKTYVEFFHPKMIGATAEKETIDKITKKYAVAYEKHFPKKGSSHYTIDHSTQAFILNREGKVAELISHGESAKKIKRKLNKYLKDD